MVSAALVLTACNDDGRVLRPAGPNQTASVSTTAPPSTIDPAQVVDTLPAETTMPAELVVSLPFLDGDPIPDRFTCAGDGVAPAFTWTQPPLEAVEIAVLVVDLDAPEPDAAGVTHFAVSAIDPLSSGLGEGQLPEFAIVATNDLGTPGYAAPCPPAGDTHRYEFSVHFLAQQTELADGTSAADLRAFIEGSSVASSSIIGTVTGTAG
jgi:Raf kinase inhibitor-like YbhB/YbcL family protein